MTKMLGVANLMHIGLVEGWPDWYQEHLENEVVEHLLIGGIQMVTTGPYGGVVTYGYNQGGGEGRSHILV